MKTITLSEIEQRTLRMALFRAVEWSDLKDSSGFYGKNWTKKERAFIARCKSLLSKLDNDRSEKLTSPW